VSFDRSRDPIDRSTKPETATRPEACPFCQSKAVGTLAKVITPSTYWRCQACGEVWNPARLESVRYGYRRSW
jgi:ribosomal protein L37AE/L43A